MLVTVYLQCSIGRPMAHIVGTNRKIKVFKAIYIHFKIKPLDDVKISVLSDRERQHLSIAVCLVPQTVHSGGLDFYNSCSILMKKHEFRKRKVLLVHLLYLHSYVYETCYLIFFPRPVFDIVWFQTKILTFLCGVQ